MMDFLYSIYHLGEKILNYFYKERPKTLGENLEKSHYVPDDLSALAMPGGGYQPKKLDEPKPVPNVPKDTFEIIAKIHDDDYNPTDFKVTKMTDDKNLYRCACCGTPHKAPELYLLQNSTEPGLCTLICEACSKKGNTLKELYDMYKKPSAEVLVPVEVIPEVKKTDSDGEDVISFEPMNSHEKTLFYKCHCCGVENPDSELQLIKNETKNTYAVICKKCLVDHLKDTSEWVKEYGRNWDEQPLKPVEEEKPRLTAFEKFQLRKKLKEQRLEKRRESYAAKKEKK